MKISPADLSTYSSQSGPKPTQLAFALLLAMAAAPSWGQIRMLDGGQEPIEPLPRINGAPIRGTPPPGAAPAPAPVTQPSSPPAPAPAAPVIAEPGRSAPPAYVGGAPAVSQPPPPTPVTQPYISEAALKPAPSLPSLPPAPAPVIGIASPTDPKNGVGQGAGPRTALPVPNPSATTPVARVATPTVEPPPVTVDKFGGSPGGQGQQGGPTQGVGISAVGVSSAQPASAGSVTTFAAPVPLAPQPSVQPVASVATPEGGPQALSVGPITATPATPVANTGLAPLSTSAGSAPSPSKQPLVIEEPSKKPPVQGTGNSLSHTAAAGRSGIGIGEILPSAQDLLSSMLPAGSIAKPVFSDQQAVGRVATPACVPVTFRPDPARAGITLVDFSGDGLIVSAIPNVHINTVFARAGYRAIDIQQAVRWCVAQTAARELLGPSYATNAHANLLVQTTNGWELMTPEQLQAQQAAIKPAPRAESTVARSAIRSGAKRVGRAPIAGGAGSVRFVSKPLAVLR